MNEAFLSLGGNMGNRLENLRAMRAALNEHCGEIVKASGIYETEAWGSDSKNSYLNQVVKLLTPLTATELLRHMLDIEHTLSRTRGERNADRTADLDILFYGQAIIDADGIHVPHPRLHLRKFVLVPLVEIEPEFIHPVFKRTVSQLLENCADTLTVALVQGI